MGEAVDVTGTKHKASSELEGVLTEFLLGVSGGSSACPSLGIVSPQQVQQVCTLEFHGLVGFALFVNKQREGDASLLAKSAGIDAVSKAHGG